VSGITPVSRAIKRAEMKDVQQGILPPNMKKPDVNNIIENKRAARVKNLGD
jgi:hypothetical protein